MKRTRPLTRTARLRAKANIERRTRLRPVGDAEKREKRRGEHTYGPMHRALDKFPCMIAGHPLHECIGVVRGHHDQRVGNGGQDEGNEVPLCAQAHAEIHASTERFVTKYGIDLEREKEKYAALCRERLIGTPT